MNILKKIKEKCKLTRIKKGNRSLKIFIVIFIVGYGFFFSSRFFFPKVYRGVDVATPGTTVDMKDYIFTLDSWDYATEDRAFEIILSVQNLTLDKKPKYDFVLKQNNNIIKSKIHKIINDEKIVIRAEDVPRRWTEVTLSINTGKATTHIGMNDKKVNEIERLENLSDKEYLLKSAKSLMEGLKAQMRNEEREIKELDEKLNYAYEKLDELEKSKDNQTEKEKTKTDNSKSQIASEMERLKGELDEKMTIFNEHKEKWFKQAEIYEKLNQE